MNIERLSEHKYRIPREDDMRTSAVFYASEEILSDLKAEDYASLKQLVNVATLPGGVESALAMPNIHWGYGFAIGGVAAFDADKGGVVSPGGVGFDVNRGVRLLVSGLATLLVDHLTSGEGVHRATGGEPLHQTACRGFLGYGECAATGGRPSFC